jgi:hypothetical protein
MKIRPLKLERKINGFTVELLRRHGRIALLLKRLPDIPTFRNWEVVVIKVDTLHPLDKQGAAEGWTHAERIPPSESWGAYGWTFVNEKTAFERFAMACADYDEKAKAGLIDTEIAEPEFDSGEPEF